MIGILLLVFVGFYFIFIRPQQNRQKAANVFVEQLKIGDEVYTVSGMYGKIVAISDHTLVIETENGAEIRFMKGAVAGYIEDYEARMPKTEQPNVQEKQNS